MNMTKKVTALLLALMMVLSLAACGGKQDNNKNDPAPAADMTAQQVLDRYIPALKRVAAAESSENSALDASTAVVLKVKDGYAQDAAAALQTSYDQVLDYSKMYSMNLPMVQQARLFVSGNYVALLILGQLPDDNTADEAKLAQDEAAKVDAAWQELFGPASNQIVVK